MIVLRHAPVAALVALAYACSSKPSAEASREQPTLEERGEQAHAAAGPEAPQKPAGEPGTGQQASPGQEPAPESGSRAADAGVTGAVAPQGSATPPGTLADPNPSSEAGQASAPAATAQPSARASDLPSPAALVAQARPETTDFAAPGAPVSGTQGSLPPASAEGRPARGSLASIGTIGTPPASGEASAPAGPTSKRHVAVGPINNSGGLTNVPRVVMGLRAPFLACYEADKAKNPGAKGNILFTLHVSSSGQVQRVDATPTGLPSAVVGCAKLRASRAKFEVAEGGSAGTVRFPATFAERD